MSPTDAIEPRAGRVLLAEVTGVHGVAGEVKLHSYTEPREAVLRYRPWIVIQGANERELARPSGRAAGQHVLARFPGVVDRDQAAAMVGAQVWVERTQLPQAKPGEFYWTDLEGLSVVTVDGVALGTVSHLFETGANDVMVVRGERERLIPFTPGVAVQSVDLATREIRVDWDPEF